MYTTPPAVSFEDVTGFLKYFRVGSEGWTDRLPMNHIVP